MKTKKICALLACITTLVALMSCSTTKNLFENKTANLTILVIDEINNPVKDFEIIIQHRKKHGKPFVQSGFTNQNGLCVFYNIPVAEYILTGQKTACTKINPGPLNFKNSAELFCYQTITIFSALDQAESLFEKGQYNKALTLLESIHADQNALLQNTISVYKAYAYTGLNQKEKANLELKKITLYD